MRVRLTIDELNQIKWLIGGILTLLSLWALSGLDLVGVGLNFIITVVICIALLKPAWVHSIPESFWGRVVVPLILVLVLIDFALGFTNLVSPLMRMVILLIIYRTLAPRNRREDLQMLLLCLFCVIVSGAITVSLLFVVQILLFAPFAMVFLLIVCLLDKGPGLTDYRPNWDQFSFRRLIQRIGHVLDLRAFLLCGLLFAFVVLVSSGVFVLIPRFDFGQSRPFMQMTTKPRTGFSETVSLNSVSEIIEDQSVALRIDVPDLSAISSLPYWRILVLDRYQNGEFSLSDQAAKLRRTAKLRELSDWNQRKVPLDSNNNEPWTFYFEGGVSQYLPLPTAFRTIRFTKEQYVELLADLQVISLDAVQKSTFSYQLENPLWDVRAPVSNLESKAFGQRDYNNGSDLNAVSYPSTTLILPVSEAERMTLSNLNRRLTGNSPTLSTAEYSERVTEYLRKNFRYSLNPDGIGGSGDPIVSWIESGSAGHCELYAGAFVLLAREAGYPARMVVGFVGGSWNAVEDFFVVRNSNAHAWAEIYDADTDDWLRVDPTPGASPLNPELSTVVNFEHETGMRAWVDSLRMQWYRRVINFDQDDQINLASSVLDIGDSILDQLSKQFKEWLSAFKNWLSNWFSYKNLLFAVLVLGLCVGMYYFWQTFLVWSDLFSRWSKKTGRLSPVRKQASHYMTKIRSKMNQSDADKSDTEALRNVYVQLQALRFGPEVSSQVAKILFKTTRKVLRQR